MDTRAPGSLFLPGDHRAGTVLSDDAFRAAMVEVERAWLGVLVDHGLAPAGAAVDLAPLSSVDDLAGLAVDAEASGNPVVPLVAALRSRLPDDAARWLHRGLTSQDVVDTALILLCREAVGRVRASAGRQVVALTSLITRHRDAAMLGRTLTRPAVPIRFGAKAAGWLHALLDAADDLAALHYPAQVGGAAGTLSGLVALTGGDVARALSAARGLADALGLEARSPWHTDRVPLLRIADALARMTAADGRIANDVLALSRTSEVREAAAGGSSTMPQKANPVLATLVRRAALAAPGHLAALHLAAADTVDERPAGAWHLEWWPLHQLGREAVVVADQTAELLAGLQVDVDAMARHLADAPEVSAERDGLAALAGLSPPSWSGADDALIDRALDRARSWRP